MSINSYRASSTSLLSHVRKNVHIIPVWLTGGRGVCSDDVTAPFSLSKRMWESSLPLLIWRSPRLLAFYVWRSRQWRHFWRQMVGATCCHWGQIVVGCVRLRSCCPHVTRWTDLASYRFWLRTQGETASSAGGHEFAPWPGCVRKLSGLSIRPWAASHRALQRAQGNSKTTRNSRRKAMFGENCFSIKLVIMWLLLNGLSLCSQKFNYNYLGEKYRRRAIMCCELISFFTIKYLSIWLTVLPFIPEN